LQVQFGNCGYYAGFEAFSLRGGVGGGGEEEEEEGRRKRREEEKERRRKKLRMRGFEKKSLRVISYCIHSAVQKI
jgi:hypothetical protein